MASSPPIPSPLEVELMEAQRAGDEKRIKEIQQLLANRKPTTRSSDRFLMGLAMGIAWF